MNNLRVIACLGNPGDKFRMTLHNAGFWVADILSKETGVEFIDAGAFLVAELPDYSIIKPNTYMNRSGSAIKAFLSAKELTADNLFVVCDDINLDLGQLRLRPKGGHGGHNGLKHIIEVFGTEDFVRLRLGVGPFQGSGELAEYVLKKLPDKHEEDAAVMAHRASDCVLMTIDKGIQTAQEVYNRKLNLD